MAYNKYNTRNSGRFNTPGQFVSDGEQQGGNRKAPQQYFNEPQDAPPQQLQEEDDVDMKNEMVEESGDDSERPSWMKWKKGSAIAAGKNPGMITKRMANKERRRRQNEHLRRLLTPKNALMALNEILPEQRVSSNFKVELTSGGPYYKQQSGHNFCADLTLDGNTYKGYGENKLTARNAAAEQALRDLVILRMSKVLQADATAAEGAVEGGEENGAGAGAGAGEEDTLPMIQLASFALHKLFAEWEYEGHKVPQLRAAPSISEVGSEAGGAVGEGAGGGAGGAGGAGGGAGRPKKAAKELPATAGDMHPCMLLTHMRPQLTYRELAVDGDRPPHLVFTIGVDVDGATYVGQGCNKKEARKAAARAACSALFNVTFSDN